MAGEESLVFRGSWRKQLILVAMFGVIAALCFVKSKSFPPMVVVGGFSAVLGVVALWGAVRGWTVLTLDSHGFETRSFDEAKRYTWNESADFASDAFTVMFTTNGIRDHFIPNLFEASTDEICRAMISYRQKYGDPERIDAVTTP